MTINQHDYSRINPWRNQIAFILDVHEDTESVKVMGSGTAQPQHWGNREMAYFLMQVISMRLKFLRHFGPFLANVLKAITRS